MEVKKLENVPKKEKQLRKNRIHFNVNDDEKLLLTTLAKQNGFRALSKFLMHKALEKEQTNSYKKHRNLVYEIHKIGVNINQISKHINILAKENSLPSLEVIKHEITALTALVEIEKHLKEIMKEVKNDC